MLVHHSTVCTNKALYRMCEINCWEKSRWYLRFGLWIMIRIDGGMHSIYDDVQYYSRRTQVHLEKMAVKTVCMCAIQFHICLFTRNVTRYNINTANSLHFSEIT